MQAPPPTRACALTAGASPLFLPLSLRRQLGWTSAQQLDGASLAPGQTFTATLASQTTAGAARGAALRVLPDWAPAGTAPLFVGYRSRELGDAELPPSLAGRLLIYSAPSAHSLDPEQTHLQAALQGERPQRVACGRRRRRPARARLPPFSCTLQPLAHAPHAPLTPAQSARSGRTPSPT